MNTKMPLYRGMTIDKTVRGLPRNIFYSLCMAGMISVALFNNVYMLIPFSLIYFVLKAINKKARKFYKKKFKEIY